LAVHRDPLDLFLADVTELPHDVEIVTGVACAHYSDPFALFPSERPPPAALRPRTAEGVQAIVVAANLRRASLWPISRGENLGYGGAAPASPTSVVLDLSRMNRILALDEADAFCLVEPGVSFTDLFERLKRDQMRLWVSAPGYGLGSLVGNALERGIGTGPAVDHASQVCGLEVVLGNGRMVRTGMGALPGSGMWQRRASGLGPRLDELFMQSSFGVVTKMGLWLMPEPEATAVVEAQFASFAALAGMVDCLAALARRNSALVAVVVSSYLVAAALLSRRSDWGSPRNPLNDATEARIRREFNLGWWCVTLRYFGGDASVDRGVTDGESAMEAMSPIRVDVSRWQSAHSEGCPHRTTPGSAGLANRLWCGELGAHIDFSVALPLAGPAVLRHALRVRAALSEIGLDYHSSFHLRERHVLNVVQILFDRSDPSVCAAVDRVFRWLIAEVATEGLGLYRAPLRFRAEAVAQYSFADHALADVHRSLKNALDPNNVLFLGKD
jgi:4-cresol dehydrogenase (hydroxylating)